MDGALYVNCSNAGTTKIIIIWHRISYQKNTEMECTAMLVLELWFWEIDADEALRNLICTKSCIMTITAVPL